MVGKAHGEESGPSQALICFFLDLDGCEDMLLRLLHMPIVHIGVIELAKDRVAFLRPGQIQVSRTSGNYVRELEMKLLQSMNARFEPYYVPRFCLWHNTILEYQA